MKRTAFLLGVGACFLVFGPLAAKPDEDELRVLRAENNLLKATAETRKKEVGALKEEIAKLSEQLRQLQEVCRNAGIAPPQSDAKAAATPPEAPKAETYMYLGKPCPKAWFEQMYRRFGDKIVRVGGKYLDVGKPLVGLTDQVSWAPNIGTAGKLEGGYRIMQVIDDDELIIRVPGWSYGGITVRDSFLHITGLDTKGLVDGGLIEAKVVYIGTYHYKTVTGAGATIPSLAVHTPLTQEQFAEALAGGLELVSYRRVERRVEQKVPGGKKLEAVAVGTPVPPP